jgi:hypothetical protein
VLLNICQHESYRIRAITNYFSHRSVNHIRIKVEFGFGIESERDEINKLVSTMEVVCPISSNYRKRMKSNHNLDL